MIELFTPVYSLFQHCKNSPRSSIVIELFTPVYSLFQHCKNSPRSSIVIELFTPVVQRILKHNMVRNNLQNLSSWFLTRSETNHAIQPTMMARDLKFQIYKVEGLYYLLNKNKGADQAAWLLLICAFGLLMLKNRFSPDTAHLIMSVIFEL